MVYNTLVEKVKTAMNIAICDNDMDFVLKLKACIDDYLARSNLAGVYELFSSPAKLLDADLLAADVVFLDVDMPEINGIEAAGLLRRKYPDVVLVFVTDYIGYADGEEELFYSTEAGAAVLYKFTDTHGPDGRGYIAVRNEEMQSFFDRLGI